MAPTRPTSFPNYHPSFPAAARVRNDETDTLNSSEAGPEDTTNASRSNHAPSRNPSEPLGVTGPVGEPGLPPARPLIGQRSRQTDQQTGGSVNASPSESARVSSEISKSARASTGSLDFRPPTSGSRTHVPMVSSRAFMNPMSSQRLQAQRGPRPTSGLTMSFTQTDEEYDEDDRSRTGSMLSPPAWPGASVQKELPAAPPKASTEYDPSYWGPEDRASEGKGSYVDQRPVEGSEAGLDALPQHQDQPRTTQEPGTMVGTKTPHTFVNDATDMEYKGQSSAHSMNGHEKVSSMDSISHEKLVKQKAAPNLGRNWEYFQGNQVFFWGGRLQTARDRPVMVVTAFLIILPTALFFGFSAPYLWHHVSPAIPIFFAYLFFVCMSSFFHAGFSDPGIVPRNLHPMPPPDPRADPMDIGPSLNEWVLVKSDAAQNGAYEVPTKYCKSCNIWRSPRCHHCRLCDNCVESQDHHCVWLNNCVGRRNYRYFFSFVGALTLLAIFLWTASIGHIVSFHQQHRVTVNVSINSNRVAFAMFLYGLIAFIYPLSLWSYHVILMARGLTTREYLNSKKFRKSDRHRPFTQKPAWKNYAVILIRPRPPTFVNLKKMYEEGDQRFGPRKGNRKTPPVPPKQNADMELRNLGAPSPGIGPTFDANGKTPR